MEFNIIGRYIGNDVFIEGKDLNHLDRVILLGMEKEFFIVVKKLENERIEETQKYVISKKDFIKESGVIFFSINVINPKIGRMALLLFKPDIESENKEIRKLKFINIIAFKELECNSHLLLDKHGNQYYYNCIKDCSDTFSNIGVFEMDKGPKLGKSIVISEFKVNSTINRVLRHSYNKDVEIKISELDYLGSLEKKDTKIFVYKITGKTSGGLSKTWYISYIPSRLPLY